MSPREQRSTVLTISTRAAARTVGAVPSYVVETFLARGDAGGRVAREERARATADELTREGTPVSFEGSIHVPVDEMCFFTFDAASGREAALVAERAGLEPRRIVEVIPSAKEANTFTKGLDA